MSYPFYQSNYKTSLIKELIWKAESCYNERKDWTKRLE